MATMSAKSRAREYYKKHPSVTLQELQDAFPEVLPDTVHKYLIEFRKLYGDKIQNVPKTISLVKLEKELAKQLEISPNSAVIKSCIDFLRLKQSVEDKTEEIDIQKFIKIGKKVGVS